MCGVQRSADGVRMRARAKLGHSASRERGSAAEQKFATARILFS